MWTQARVLGLVMVAACGSRGGTGSGSGAGSAGGSGSVPTTGAAATGSARTGGAAAADSDLAAMTALADQICACTTQACSNTAYVALMKWETPHRAFTQTLQGQTQLHRVNACSDALDARTGGNGSAVQVSMGDDPAASPAGLSATQRATVEAKITELQSIGAAVAGSADCAAAAAVMRSHATGFVSLKAVMRAANPAGDPKIDTYFEQVDLPRALGAIGPILNSKCDTPDWSAAMDAQDFLGMKTVH